MNLPAAILKMRSLIALFVKGFLNSYSIVFFSNSHVLAIFILIATMFDPVAGFCGIIGVFFTNLAAWLIGFSGSKISNGLYGFNSLLISLGLGMFFEWSYYLLAMVIAGSLLALLVTVLFDGWLGKYGLPFLSVPFLLVIWVLTLAGRQYTSLAASERGIYRLNEIYDLGGQSLLELYQKFESFVLPDSVLLYFKSLAAVFFQTDWLAGLVLAIGLLIFSRIAFTLSLLGFFSAIGFYSALGGNIHELQYSFVGFNFILTGIAIGGFFYIPSKSSYLWVLLLTPLLSMLASSLTSVLWVYQLSIYSLPFNLIVIMVLYAFQFRERRLSWPEQVGLQLFSPEKNLYEHTTNRFRFGNNFFPVSLPVVGRWMISQSHDGEYTHKGDWKHAWDFEVRDENGKSYAHEGNELSDYYAYAKPVQAPADALVEEVVDHVSDNAIGDVNAEQNWGNTIVLRHSSYLFSKMSHLKSDSIKVKKGDFVKKGDILACVGNSGRSPYPHLHFQIQATPYIGSKTLKYPLSNYFNFDSSGVHFISFGIPQNDECVEAINPDPVLKKAFHMIPGQVFNLNYTSKGTVVELKWEVFTNALNQSYIYCWKTGATAYFKMENDVFYFTSYYGRKGAMLYNFCIGLNKVIIGAHKGLNIEDRIPINRLRWTPIMPIHDLLAPFIQFMQFNYHLSYVLLSDNILNDERILESQSSVKLFGKSLQNTKYQTVLKNGAIEKFLMEKKNVKVEVKWQAEV